MSQSTVDGVLAVLLTAVLTTMWVMVSRQRTTRTAWQTALRDQGDQFSISLNEQATHMRASLDQQAAQFRESIEGLSRSFAEQMQRVSLNLTELNTGASAGARAAIADLRDELRNGVRDVTRDLGQLRGEHDNLAERHNSLNGTVVQVIERGNATREAVHEIRRDIYAVRDRTGQQQGSGA